MDPSGPPLPLSSSLCSPTTTPCSSPQKTSNPSLPLNSTQHDSPEAQCTCPYEPFLSELKAAKTLMGFKLYPVPTLHPFPYPSDTITGMYIPVAELRKYSRTHVWPDGMHCFCSLRPGGEERSVQFFVPSQGVLQGSPCLACPDWTPDGTSGCRYLVKLNELFKDRESLFGTDIMPLKNFRLRENNRKRTRTRLATSGAHTPASTASLLLGPGRSISKSSAHDIDYAPLSFRVKPGSISNPARIWSPPSYDVSVPVEDMPIPPDSVVREVLSEMLNGCGVPFHQLMAIIGSCAACNQVMVLPNILTHPCPGRTKEPGPHPSKYPRLLEDRRVLPTAGSRIKELNAIQGTMGADHRSDNYGDAELVDKVGHSQTHKRKLGFNLPPQRVFVGQLKKPRITNTGGPSRMTHVSSQPAEIVDLTGSPIRISTPVSSQPAEIVDLTGSPIRISTPVFTQPAEVVDFNGSPICTSTPVFTQLAGTFGLTSPVRIPTPDDSREVYRDVNGEFLMYKKA